MAPQQRDMVAQAPAYDAVHEQLKDEFDRLEQEYSDGVRQRMVGLFRKYHPTQLAEVDRLMMKYAGKLEELELRLDRKFGSREAGRHLQE